MAEKRAPAHGATACRLIEFRIGQGRAVDIVGAEPISAPLPHVAAHVEEAEAVGLLDSGFVELQAEPIRPKINKE